MLKIKQIFPSVKHTRGILLYVMPYLEMPYMVIRQEEKAKNYEARDLHFCFCYDALMSRGKKDPHTAPFSNENVFVASPSYMSQVTGIISDLLWPGVLMTGSKTPFLLASQF